MKTIKVRAKKTFLNDVGTVRRGEVVDLPRDQARDLIRRGVAEAAPAKTDGAAPTKSAEPAPIKGN